MQLDLKTAIINDLIVAKHMSYLHDKSIVVPVVIRPIIFVCESHYTLSVTHTIRY